MSTESPIPLQLPASSSIAAASPLASPATSKPLDEKENIRISLLPDPTPAHAPALHAWTTLFGAKSSTTTTTSRPHPDQPTFKATYSYPNGRLLLASTPENPVAGLVAYRKYDGRFAHLPEVDFSAGTGGGERSKEQNIVEVVRLFVAPELRNQGIATLLVRALVRLARDDGVDFMYLHTHPFLPGAERLWEKEGWMVLVREAQEPWFTIHMGRRV